MSDGVRITGVLDWNNTCTGDPRADVARTYQILRAEHFGAGRTPPHVKIFAYRLERAWRRGYQQIAGPLRDMPLFYAWAGAYMQRDLAQHVDRPESWVQAHHVESIRSWTEAWKRRAGITQ